MWPNFYSTVDIEEMKFVAISWVKCFEFSRNRRSTVLFPECISALGQFCCSVKSWSLYREATRLLWLIAVSELDPLLLQWEPALDHLNHLLNFLSRLSDVYIVTKSVFTCRQNLNHNYTFSFILLEKNIS